MRRKLMKYLSLIKFAHTIIFCIVTIFWDQNARWKMKARIYIEFIMLLLYTADTWDFKNILQN